MDDPIINDDVNQIIEKLKKFENSFKGKKFLVTGGGGFLGSWVCDVLLKLGGKVTCQDNFASGIEYNIKHLLEHENFEFVKLDVREKIADGDFDFLIHMASRASPEDYNRYQVETLLTNSEGLKNVLEHTKKNKSICLFASTSEIYGDAKIIPTPEEYWGNTNSIGERSCYDEGKRYGEALCAAYKQENKVNVKIVRIFNTYGPRIRPDGLYGRALPRFVLRALNNEDIVIFGDGNQTRSFCYVSDTITGILLFLVNNSNQFVLNIGGRNEITINELAQTIIKHTNSKSKIKFAERMPDDPRRRSPDISKAKKVLDWKPIVSLEDGLEKTINWLSRNKVHYEEKFREN